ncbi:MAG TPA: thioredoxin-like domain-containing protein, partial [Vicinamibacterales bacterium]|nr:thioredoxin-like domain-containing protein [Vicinamibacterales bacterium]
MPEERIHAPELTGAIDWLNVPKPLTLKDLRGKVVLLDFWTYGCVNCMHVIPELRRLEEKYRDALVVIGVHSAKFTNERASENIRRILVRYDIDHPVANDAEFRIWREYGARAWPTLVLIDPEGYVVATASGEGKGEAFDQAIGAVIAFFDEQGKIDRRPIALAPERERLKSSTLAFPGKVAVDGAANRLLIADSNHHRVLVTTLDGKVIQTIGDGQVGLVDGGFDAARFYRPQGLALEGDTLYIADTENHVIRAADLSSRTVTTIAGTGRQAQWGASGGAARESSLNSPWDVLIAGRLVFIAMAGAHQIWMLDRERPLVMVYAGSGREARLDGAIDDAAFAQPSGLARKDDTLYVADSEANIVRAIGLPPSNQVRTIAGGDLFEFGDIDGTGDAARLQHPLGIAWAAGRLFIADTYNHKIKVLDPVSGRVTTFAGDGFPGADDGKGKRARFYEPGGICATDAALYVADTNNHAIRRVDLSTAEVTT